MHDIIRQLEKKRELARLGGGVTVEVTSVKVDGGKLVAELEHVSKSYGQQPVVRDFSARIQRGDRIGVIGPNGAGKTTLLRLILGELQPDAGSVRLGTKIDEAVGRVLTHCQFVLGPEVRAASRFLASSAARTARPAPGTGARGSSPPCARRA